MELERQFAHASQRLEEAESICRRLKENRGTLHEDQYDYRLQRHAQGSSEREKIESRQRQVRWIHKGYHVALSWAVLGLRDAVLDLEKAVSAVQDALGKIGEEDVCGAIISNLVAADVLVREVRDVKLATFQKEANVDPTDGASGTAFTETFQQLLSGFKSA